MKWKYSFRLLFTFGVLFLFANCQKQDHAYEKFIKDGERIYIGRADNVIVHSGKNRVGLSWDIKDPRADQIKIIFNDGVDSVVMKINKTVQTDRFETIIDNLDERLYSFHLFVLDDRGNSSVAQIVDGQSYGESFRNTLNNRGVNRTSITNNDLLITWFTGNSQMQYTEIKYFKIDNSVEQSTIIEANESSIQLSDVDFEKDITYRTAYKPSLNALDTFLTNYSKLML